MGLPRIASPPAEADRPAETRHPAPAYDLARVRADFPILGTRVHDRPLAYLDNAASMQKPRAVMAAVVDCWSSAYSNVGRSVHTLARRAGGARAGGGGEGPRPIGGPAPGGGGVLGRPAQAAQPVGS